MDVVIAIVAKIGEYTVAPVGRQIGYVFSYRSNMDNLDSKIQQLEHKKNRLQHSVDEAKNNGHEIEADVQEWLDKVPGVTEKARNFRRDECRANTRCLNVSFPNPVWRHRLSRKAKKMVQSITSEIQAADGFGQKVSYLPTHQSSIRNKGYEEFGSRMSTLRMVMKALRDPNVNMIGLHGMGGVGKTMLAKEVARKAMEEKLFSQAILVTVSQNPDYKSIQQEIAGKLGLKLDDQTSLPARADRLRSRLRQEKMILIIVDDVWKRIDLDEDVGISFGGDQKQCKILLTSRLYNALKNNVRNENTFQVGTLSESESMDLFNKTADDSDGKPEFPDLATEIVKECGGLPLAITVVASALRKQSCHVWKNALHELKMASPNNIEGMHERVYSSVKLSYNYLPSEETKSLLLLCSLFPEDANIYTEDLLKYALGLGLFQGSIPNMEVAKNRMFTLVENLKRSSLLLDGDTTFYSKDCVKLHDVIRDVAIDIAYKERRWYNIRNLDELDEYMRRDHKKFKDAIAISLLSCTNVVEQLPAERLESPQLQLLLINMLQRGSRHGLIADRFLEGLKELRVLFLCYVNLDPLPSSFPFLHNLRTLRLIGCRLGNISLIGELKNLEILELSGSGVVELGSEIGQLTRLRVLDLGNFYELVIQPNVLGSLRNLEWLTLSSSFRNWEVEGASGRERRNASLSELKHLPQLSSLLNLSIPDVNVLPKDIFGEKLESYSIQLGTYWSRIPSYDWLIDWTLPYNRILLLELQRSSQLDELGLGNLLRRSDAIGLKGLEGMNSVAYELDKDGFPHCKRLLVANNAGILHIVNSVGQTAFLNLEILILENLVKLEKICHGRLAPDSFRNLRRLRVFECHRLKSVFCFSIAKLLEEIEVRYCEMIEEIVDNDEAINAKIEFPRLRTLRLVKLPKLLQYCSDYQPKSTTNTSSIPLFNEKVEFPNMKELELQSLNSFQMIWDTLLLQKFDNNLTRVTVKNCDNLKSLIPASLCGSLVHLERLEIGGCENIREVVSIEESAGQEKLGKITFPLLKSLKIYDLPKLKRFCAGDCIECPSLNELDIANCGKVETFISNSLPSHIDNENEEIESVNKQPLFIKDKVEFPNMKELELQSLNSFQMIWDTLLLQKFDNNLTRVTVKNCDNLKSLIPASLRGSLVHLERLEIGGCENIREVVSIEESAGQEKLGKITFPLLKSLKIYDLPKLKRFCAGDCIECPSLNELDIANCGKVETFISNSLPSHIDNENEEIESVNKQPLFIKDKVEFPNMKELELQSLNSFQMIWDTLLLQKFDNNLTRVTVKNCDNLKSLIPASLRGSLVHLERLEIGGCENIREVVSIEESAGQEKLGKITFPLLKSLKIYDLPKLKRFCAGDCIECPSLNELDIANCGKVETFISNSLPSHIDNENEEIESVNKQPLFIKDKVEFPNMKELELQSLNSFQMIWDTLLLQKFDNNLTRVTVKNCDNLKSLIPASLRGSLVHLERLEIGGCENIREVVSIEESAGQEKLGKITFPLLKSLKIYDLPKLKRFCAGDCIECPSLNELDIANCGKVETFISNSLPSHIDNENEEIESVNKQPLFIKDKVEFPNMKELELQSLNSFQMIWDTLLLQKFDNNLTRVTVKNCDNLKSLIPASLRGSLVHLERLEIGGCENIREVVSIEESAGQEKLGKITFPLLKSLKIYDLPKLKRFCAGDCIECPSLNELDIANCGKVETFISNSLPSHIDNENEEIESVNKQPLFIKDKVEFPNMKELELQSLNSFQMIWDTLLLQKFDNNLTRVTVKNCDNLKSLIPASLRGSLVHLERLEIGGCENIREVVSIEESAGQEKLGKITFPLLKSLKIYDLPKLKRFCAGDCIECPSLNELDIANCGKVETFISNSLPSHIDNENEEIESVNKQPLFIKDKVEFPNMKELELQSLNSFQMIWDTLLLQKFDNNLTRVTVKNCDNLKSLIPASLRGSLVHLERLEIGGCENIREVVSIEESAGQEKLGKITFPLLKSLKIYDLPKLKRFCAGDCIECPSLNELDIANCGKVETFISNSLPSHIDNENEEIESVNKQPLFIKDKVEFPNMKELELQSLNSFQMIWDTLLLQKFDNNLTRVTVKNCDNLKSLIPASLRGSLVHLERLEIGGCENIREVVSIEESAGQEKLGKITFPLLKSLKIYDLPKLKRFCAGDCIECPSLNELDIANCGKVETFISNSLPSHIDNENEEIESVNKQPLFIKDKVEFPNMEQLKSESLNSFQIIWDTLLLQKFDNNLTRVTVKNCDNLKSLIPASLCGSLVHLERLKIGACENIREVVSIEESAGQEKLGKILFPQLKSFKLYGLPKLKRFCAGDCIEFPSLEKLYIQNCGKMETFVSNSLPSPIDNENEEIESINKQPLFIKDKVKFPNLKALKIQKIEVINGIWHGDQSSTLPFPKLKSIELDSNFSESYKFSFKFVQGLEHLKRVCISGLFMESLISSDEAHDILLPLRILDLDALPKLMHLCDEGVQTCKTFRFVEDLNVSRCERIKSLMTSSMSFQNLTSLSVSDCDALENLMASAAAAKSLQQLTEMEVCNCKRMTQIIGNNHEAECDVETEQNEIGFSNLKILRLDDFCSLGKFYSGNNIIRLPNLEQLVVTKCPEMRTFSHGTVYTPSLYRITIKLKWDWLIKLPELAKKDDVEYQELLEGDVNTTLQKLWEDHQAADTSSQRNITWYVLSLLIMMICLLISSRRQI